MKTYAIKGSNKLINVYENKIIISLFYKGLGGRYIDPATKIEVEGYTHVLKNFISLIELSDVTMWTTNEGFIIYYLCPFNCYISYSDYKGSMGEFSHTLIYDTTTDYSSVLKKKCELDEEGKKLVIDEIKSVFAIWHV